MYIVGRRRFFPDVFPPSFRGHDGDVAVYFEAAAVIMTLGAARPGAGAARAQQNQQSDQSTAGAGAQDRTALA